jgi:AAA domain (dynein-related subfamily)
MKRFLLFLRDYFISEVSEEMVTAEDFRMPDAGSLCETGPAMIEKVRTLIALRRPVLLTGSRGCGKSRCAHRGILLAEKNGLIGGNHFIQGNRDHPREYLSEDSLVIDGGKAVSIPALAMTPIGAKPDLSNVYQVEKPKAYIKWLEEKGLDPADYPWPAMPASLVDAYIDDPEGDPRSLFWRSTHWWVLFLDEVNRFGDGFLDSLLSLAEEGKIVRRGQAYYVPVVLVFTANPPGYDVTAKRLSPPLQSRIAAAYRIAQPSHDVLNAKILEDRLKQLRYQVRATTVIIPTPGAVNGSAGGKLQIVVSNELRALACAYLLCLWGDPGIQPRNGARVTKGVHYLLPQTRLEIFEVAAKAGRSEKNRSLFDAWDDLGGVSEYGPDARAIGDWFALVIQNKIDAHDAKSSNDPIILSAADLRKECVAVLGKKIRETYNEASEPEKDGAKETLLLEIFDLIFSGPNTKAILRLVYGNRKILIDEAEVHGEINAENIAPGAAIRQHIEATDPRWRSRYIEATKEAISTITQVGDRETWEKWRNIVSQTGLLSPVLQDGCFQTMEARNWIAKAICLVTGNKDLAKAVLLLPCRNTVSNLREFVGVAQGKINLSAAAYFPLAQRVGTGLTDAQVDTLVTVVNRLYKVSPAYRCRRSPERALSLVLGFRESLSQQQPPEVVVAWYLGWFLEEAVSDTNIARDLIHPFMAARPVKQVLAEAVTLGNWAFATLEESADGNETTRTYVTEARNLLNRRASELKRAMPSKVAERTENSGGTDDMRKADMILTDQQGNASVNEERASARRKVFPFNLAGY